MKKLLLILPLIFLSVPTTVKAQYYGYEECTRTREVYRPGYYDRYGRYRQGYVTTEEYPVPCVTQRTPYYNRVQCDPTKTLLGGILGGGVAASMSRGNGYRWSVPLGAFIGGAALGCN